MKSQELFKQKIKDGIIGVPGTEEEAINLVERYFSISKISDDPSDLVETFKESFLKVHGYKSGGDGGAYISTIKSALSTAANKKLDEVILAWHGVDLTTHAIQRLIVDGKIRLAGKKVYLL